MINSDGQIRQPTEEGGESFPFFDENLCIFLNLKLPMRMGNLSCDGPVGRLAMELRAISKRRKFDSVICKRIHPPISCVLERTGSRALL